MQSNRLNQSTRVLKTQVNDLTKTFKSTAKVPVKVPPVQMDKVIRNFETQPDKVIQTERLR